MTCDLLRFFTMAQGRNEKTSLHPVQTNSVRNDVSCGLAEHSLRPATSDSLLHGKPEGELHELMIEKWNPGLDAMRHAVAILPLEKSRETLSEDHFLEMVMLPLGPGIVVGPGRNGL